MSLSGSILDSHRLWLATAARVGEIMKTQNLCMRNKPGLVSGDRIVRRLTLLRIVCRRSYE